MYCISSKCKFFYFKRDNNWLSKMLTMMETKVIVIQLSKNDLYKMSIVLMSFTKATFFCLNTLWFKSCILLTSFCFKHSDVNNFNFPLKLCKTYVRHCSQYHIISNMKYDRKLTPFTVLTHKEIKSWLKHMLICNMSGKGIICLFIHFLMESLIG